MRVGEAEFVGQQRYIKGLGLWVHLATIFGQRLSRVLATGPALAVYLEAKDIGLELGFDCPAVGHRGISAANFILRI